MNPEKAPKWIIVSPYTNLPIIDYHCCHVEVLDYEWKQLISIAMNERVVPKSWCFETDNCTWPMKISWPDQILFDKVRMSQGKGPLEVKGQTWYFKPGVPKAPHANGFKRELAFLMNKSSTTILWSRTGKTDDFKMYQGARSDHLGGGGGEVPSWAANSEYHEHTLGGCINGYWTLQYTLSAKRR